VWYVNKYVECNVHWDDECKKRWSKARLAAVKFLSRNEKELEMETLHGEDGGFDKTLFQGVVTVFIRQRSSHHPSIPSIVWRPAEGFQGWIGMI